MNVAPRIGVALRRRFQLLMAPGLLLLPLLATLAGCGEEEWQATTYPASLPIRINGEPPQGAVVTLHPVHEKIDQRGSTPWGLAGEDGVVEFSTYEKGDGAPAGEYAVTIRWPENVSDMAAAMTDRLGGAYATADRSEWKVTITDGENTLAPLDIQVAPNRMRQRPVNLPPGGPVRSTKQ